MRGEALLNVKAKLTPDDLARACAEAMWKEDDASKGLGMEIVEIKPGQATLQIDSAAAHGQRPADRAWRLHLHPGRFRVRLCLQHPQRTYGGRARQHQLQSAQASSATDWSRPAREISRSGRSGIYDVQVTANDTAIAEFRGHSRTIGGTWLPEKDNDAN